MRRQTMIQAAVATLALGSLAWAAVPVTWHWLGVDEVAPAPVAEAAPRVETAEAPVDLETIIAANLFGSAPPATLVVTEVAETALDLSLRGIVMASNPQASIAMIDAEGIVQGYRPGDPISGRATLLEVAPEHVLLDVDGRQEILSFDEDRAPGEASGGMSGVDRLAAAALGGASSAPAPPALETTEDYIQHWRERIQRNPGQVLDEIGLVATDRGYVIADRHDIGVARAGLKAGDTVTRVNGQEVGDVEKDRKFYDEIAASGQARVELERDGKTIVLTFPLR